MKVLLVADNCSKKMGGEAILPYHYYRILKKKKMDVNLLVHERNKSELIELFGENNVDIYYVEDTNLQKWCWKIGSKMPKKIADATLFSISFLSANFRMRAIAKKIVKENKIDVVHQVTPVSPKAPSFLYGLKAPVMIGPMNGGMEYPEYFKKKINFIENIFHRAGKKFGKVINLIISGKRKAVLLIAANERSANSIREAVNHKKIEILPENGVDLDLWKVKEGSEIKNSEIIYTYVGRVVDWKRVDFLIKALSQIDKKYNIKINIVGDGQELSNLKSLAKNLKVEDRVNFMGFIEQNKIVNIVINSTALLLPSIYECGGAVVLEAMALKKAVIAVNWGGPSEYLDKECGILINPDSEEKIVEEFSKAMIYFAENPKKSIDMGEKGREKIEKEFDWDKKGDKIIEYYKMTIKG